MTGIHFGNEDEVSNIRCRTGVSGRPRLVTNFARIEGEGTSVVTCAVDTSATGAGIWAVQVRVRSHLLVTCTNASCAFVLFTNIRCTPFFSAEQQCRRDVGG